MKKLLLLDDEKCSIVDYVLYLESDEVGREVKHIRSFSEALREIRTQLSAYSCVIIDVRIKPSSTERMSPEAFRSAGITIYREVRRLDPKARVVILTNNFSHVPDEEISADTFAVALDKSHTKPDELWRKIRELELK